MKWTGLFHLDVTAAPRRLTGFMATKQMKIAEPVQSERKVYLAMTTILTVRGIHEWRQHKTAVIARRNDVAIFHIFRNFDI